MADEDAVLRLGRTGVVARLILLTTLVALFVSGSLVGQDSWWPFGPWRMFATSTPPTGTIGFMAIEYRDPAGQWHPAELRPDSVGLNRAEIEGRMPQIAADPSLLSTLAAAHSRLRPHEDAWIGVRVVRVDRAVLDGTVTDRTTRTVLATWQAQ